MNSEDSIKQKIHTKHLEIEPTFTWMISTQRCTAFLFSRLNNNPSLSHLKKDEFQICVWTVFANTWTPGRRSFRYHKEVGTTTSTTWGVKVWNVQYDGSTVKHVYRSENYNKSFSLHHQVQIVSVPHPWQPKDHPDPDGSQLSTSAQESATSGFRTNDNYINPCLSARWHTNTCVY